MSRLATLAQEERKRGELERGRWEPRRDTAHYRLYKRWQQITGKYRPQENFCHYCWVIAVWAPLAIMRKMLADGINRQASAFERFITDSRRAAPFNAPVALVVVGILLVAWAAEPVAVSITIGSIFGGFYVAFGLSVTVEIIARQLFGRHGYWPWLRRQSGFVLLLLVIIGLVPITATYVVALVLIGLATAIWWVFEKKELHHTVLDFLFDVHPERAPWLRPWLAFPTGLIVGAFFSEIALSVLVALVGFGVFIGLLVLCGSLIDAARDTKNRIAAERKAAQHDAIMARVSTFALLDIHARLHPKRAGNTWHFEQWLQRYIRHCTLEGRYVGYCTTFAEVPYWTHYGQNKFKVPQQLYAFKRELEAELQQAEATPSKGQKLLRGAGDFFQLGWNFVLARKWKICPLVTVD